MTTPQGALLVGSINLPDAETTFRTAAHTLGHHLKRVPDGEPGVRFHWIAFQPDRIAATPGIERIGDQPVLLNGLDVRPVRVADGVDMTSLVLAPLGYAEAALESWREFHRLRDAGVIAPGTRFQVSLPTPAAVVAAFVDPAQAAAFEPVYAAAVYAELDSILAVIPHEDLAVQWDTAVEFAFIEGAEYPDRFGGAFRPWFDDVWTGVIDRAADQSRHVPEPVELGYHLCYGDAGEQHFFEPVDTGNLVRFANLLAAAVERPIQWVHLPVPIGRDDDAYFTPLAQLELKPETEIYLGLMHREDLVEGASRRIEAAARHAPTFGIATECGIGRAPAAFVAPLLQAHADVCRPW